VSTWKSLMVMHPPGLCSNISSPARAALAELPLNAVTTPAAAAPQWPAGSSWLKQTVGGGGQSGGSIG
jgi:hypothetical protein